MFLTIRSAPAEYREAGEYQEILHPCQRRKKHLEPGFYCTAKTTKDSIRCGMLSF